MQRPCAAGVDARAVEGEGGGQVRPWCAAAARWRAGAAAAALGCAVAAVVALRGVHAARTANGLPLLRAAAVEGNVSAAAEAEACSGPLGNCWDVPCCKATGESCFAKDLQIARCKSSCKKGVDPTERREYQTDWSCLQVSDSGTQSAVTPAAECADVGENCIESRCCQDSDLKCYLKHDSWAECREDCHPELLGADVVPGGRMAKPWSCVALRPRGELPALPPPGASEDCSLVTEDCRKSRCCQDPTMGCYERDEAWAGCLRHCAEGSDWSCGLLAPPRLLPSTLTGTSLFCFALMLPFGYEVDLLNAQFEKRAGIFLCDQSAVFSNTSLSFGNASFGRSLQTTVVEGSLFCTLGGLYHTAMNTEIFVRIWRGVFRDGRYARSDWTAKVDPDAVFLPGRLRQHLGRYLRWSGAETNTGVYLNNCKDGMHGPLEVLSRGAMLSFASGIDICVEGLKHEFTLYGEDVFFRHCMLVLGVERFNDFGLLYETVCDPYPADPMPCTPMKVAFHPLKTEERYFGCLRQAQEQEEEASGPTIMVKVGI